jgi:hypothetical protein
MKLRFRYAAVLATISALVLVELAAVGRRSHRQEAKKRKK